MKHLTYIIPACILAFTACSNNPDGKITATNGQEQTTLTPFRISSTDFKEGDTISEVNTCDSTNISPELHWNNPFNNTASFALIVEDPDAPMGTVTHWTLYNIPAKDTVLKRNTPKDSVLENGAKQGITTFGTLGYGGPCPPNGAHHYHFKLYALDATLPYPAGLSKNKLLNSMKGHILAEADLVGLYKKKKGYSRIESGGQGLK